MKVKNSNKILILILMLTIAIPFLMAQVFLHKIKNNQFVYEKPTIREAHPELNMEGSMEGVKAVKIVGKNFAELLGATILHNDLNSYLITRERAADSVLVNHSGDTLIFQYYTGSGGNNHRYNRAVKLRINLPENIPVIANSCQINYELGVNEQGTSLNDSLKVNPYSPAIFYLDEGAVLNLGSEALMFKATKDTTLLRTAGLKGGQVFIRDSSSSLKDSLAAQFARAGSVFIYANKSMVKLNQAAAFDKLGLTMDKSSSLEMNDPIKINVAEISIDPQAHIEGNYRAVKSIRALAKDK